MKIIVTPGQSGLISNAGQIIGQALPDGAMLVDVASLDIPPMSAAIVEGGEVKIVANWLGSGPWFDQQASTADRLTPIEITEYGIAPKPTWEMTPRPEMPGEIADREADEAKAAKIAEAARKASRVVSPVQIRLAASETGLRQAIESVVAAKGTPLAVKDFWEYSPLYRRDDPAWAALMPLINAQEADIDALYDTAEAK